MATRMSYNATNAQADALSALLDGGVLRIYSGTQVANADTGPAGDLLAELGFNADAAPAAVNGVLTMNSLTAESSAPMSGTAGWFRALKSDGTTTLFDGSVGVIGSGANLELTSTTITSGTQVSVTAFTHTVPRS